MPDVLQWGQVSVAGLDTVFEAYTAFVDEALGYALGDCGRQDNALARDLAARLQTVPARDFLRVVLAPDFTYRLLWRHPDRIQRVCAFLDEALHVEAVIDGREKANGDTWTALGDVRVLRSGEVLQGAKIPGLPALDFDSPNVTSGKCRPDPANDKAQVMPLSNNVRPMVIDRMTTAWHEIAATSKIVADFVARFVQVIVLRSRNTSPGFSSGSDARYTGLIVIENADSKYCTDIVLAEAMVHEAMHSLLNMTLHTMPWGADNGRAFTDAEIVSPWSGAPLPVDTFLHACFVWYGLLHFWRQVLRVKAFKDEEEVRGRMAEALKGFLGPPVLDKLCSEDRKIVRDDVSHAIETMQSQVKARFGFR